MGKLLKKKRDGQFGVYSKDQEANQAYDLIRDAAFKTTRCGKQHWAMMGYNPMLGGPPPKEQQPQPLFKPVTQASVSSPCFLTKRTPRFLREFREAKQQGKLVGKAARLARERNLGSIEDSLVGPRPKSAVPLRAGQPGAKPTALPRRPASATDAAAKRPSFGMNGAVNCRGRSSRSHCSPAWARTPAEADKIAMQRKMYCGSLVAPLPAAKPDVGRRGEAWKEPSVPSIQIAAARRAGDLRQLGQMKFNPERSFDFVISSKTLSLWNHYDMARA